MVDIVVSDEQARAIREASGGLRVCDPQGRVIFAVAPRSLEQPDDVDAMRRAIASSQPRYTTQQVLDHLDSLADK
jgi:hypothetical protein